MTPETVNATACDDEMRRRVSVCAHCGTTRAHRAHGWCSPCYRRWLRAGQPASGVPPLIGYRPPHGQDEVDHAAVFRAITNDDVPPLTWAERKQATPILRRQGMSSRAIGAQLGCHSVTAWRYGKAAA